MLKLLALTSVAIFSAEALIMLLLERKMSGFPLAGKIVLDGALLTAVTLATLYFLYFREMMEQISYRRDAEMALHDLNRNLEAQVEERTEQLRRANEDLLVEVQERARISMVLRKSFQEERADRESLQALVDALTAPLLVVDQHRCLQMANRSAESRFGFSQYELRGRRIEEHLPGCPEPCLESSFEWAGERASVLMFCPEKETMGASRFG